MEIITALFTLAFLLFVGYFLVSYSIWVVRKKVCGPMSILAIALFGIIGIVLVHMFGQDYVSDSAKH